MKNRSTIQIVGLYLGLLLFVLSYFFYDPEPSNPLLGKMLSVVVLMATWWVTEAIPLAITSLLPLVLFPLFKINNPETTAGAYMNSIILLYIGGFLVALAMEKWNLHRRIALNIIYKIGKDPRKLILGFMIAASFLSMWMSNTACAVMMLPIGMAIILKLEEEFDKPTAHKLSVSLLVSIAYGTSIGGTATLIGTPTNLAFAKIYSSTFHGVEPITFSQWFVFGLPISIVILFVSWYIIVNWVAKIDKNLGMNSNLIKRELDLLGRMSYEEKVVIVMGSLTALLWIFRKDIAIGNFAIPGWSNISSAFILVDDSTVAVTMAVLLFIWPSKNGKAKAMLEASAIRDLPWTAILLFGGGFAIADGFTASGLTKYFAAQFNLMGHMPLYMSILLSCLVVTLVTEFVSNIATVQMFLPVLAAWALAQHIHPLYLMIPATIMSSMAFMMPVGTPPNAVIFGSGRISIADMVKYGWGLKIASLIIVVIMILILFTLLDINSMFPMNMK